MRTLILLLMICGMSCLGIDKAAIAELNAGKRTEADVDWWAEDESDNTQTLQNALDSGVQRIIIPYKATPWISGPLFLRSNQEIILEKGAVLQAKDDAFYEAGSKFLNLNQIENVTIRGDSASIRMNRGRYLLPPFYQSGLRHLIDIKGCKNIKIIGLSLTDAGGDAICISGGSEQYYAENILLRDVKCQRNFRQGLSVISAKNLTAENCLFAESGGAPPAAGVFLNPESDRDRLENLVFQNCRMKNNNGEGFLLYALNLTENAVPFSIKMQTCVIDGSWQAGLGIGGITWDGPDGIFDIINCEIKNTVGPGIYIREKSSTRLQTRFFDCKLADTALGTKRPWPDEPWTPKESYWLTKENLNAPIVIASGRPHLGQHVGYVEFISCIVQQNRSRPTVILFDIKNKNYAERIKGTIKLFDAQRPYLEGTEGCYDVNLKFVNADDKEIGSRFILGMRQEYTPLETNIEILSRKAGEYYPIQKDRITYNAILTPNLKVSQYRLGFRYKTPPDFQGHMLLQAPGASLLLKATNDKWKTVALHGVELSEYGRFEGKVPINISALNVSDRINKIAVENWQLAAERNILDH
ncbi:MAG: right-handed parallel beta-helix repeat-containing protein [Victivallaceae bacterium]|nr:right-handed parallel beta-helix repeat-containing protein [Victivallaceae bacterium]